MVENQSERKIEIAVCVPSYGSVPSKFFENFVGIIAKNMDRYVLHIFIQSMIPVDKARNELVKSALERNPDFIFFWDCDNLVPDGVFDRLIAVMEDKKADLVTGLYFEKNKPYSPVIREYHDGGFWKIENPPLGQVLEIAGSGFGCVLVKTEVFRKIPEPWFKFNYERWAYKDIQLSEDLYFCREMIRRNMKLYCDTGLISSHIGSGVDAFEYMSFAPIRTETIEDREELFNDIAEFMKEPRGEVGLKMVVGSKFIKDEWNAKNPKTPEEIKKFYKETPNYLYDLAAWHFTERRQFDVELLTACKRDKNKNILDFGCGIGQNAMMLARKGGMDVTIADLDSKTLDFAIFRFTKHNTPHKVWKVDVEPPPQEKFDAILCFDVLEHLPKEDFADVVEKLIKMKHKDTKVYLTATFGKTETHPMHTENDEDKQNLIDRLLNEVPQ